jgi:hypothetical protein
MIECRRTARLAYDEDEDLAVNVLAGLRSSCGKMDS